LHKSFPIKNAAWRTFPNTTEDSASVPEALFTRYQPRVCHRPTAKEKMLSKETCNSIKSTKHFQNYNFHWNQNTSLSEVLNKYSTELPTNQDQKEINICFVGASHSRALKNSCQLITEHVLLEMKESPRFGALPSIVCRTSNSWYPSDITSSWVASNLRHCTYAVVGLFQWFFSYQNKARSTITFSDWKNEMQEAVKTVINATTNHDIPLRKIILRSAHANAFKATSIACPPVDYRHPPNNYVATSILQGIAKDYAHRFGVDQKDYPIVSVVDTSPILDPVWDSAEDWSHYADQVEWAETVYIMSEILKGA